MISGPLKRAPVLSNEKFLSTLFVVCCWVFFGDEILASYVGIIVNHYKDPVIKQPGFPMESKGPRVFWTVAMDVVFGT